MIAEHARTGELGDGKIFVYDVSTRSGSAPASAAPRSSRRIWRRCRTSLRRDPLRRRRPRAVRVGGAAGDRHPTRRRRLHRLGDRRLRPRGPRVARDAAASGVRRAGAEWPPPASRAPRDRARSRGARAPRGPARLRARRDARGDRSRRRARPRARHRRDRAAERVARRPASPTSAPAAHARGWRSCSGSTTPAAARTSRRTAATRRGWRRTRSAPASRAAASRIWCSTCRPA